MSSSPAVHRTCRFESALVRIETNRCGREDPSLSCETPPLGWHEVTLPRSGIWYRHQGRRVLPVDLSTVHFFHRGETYRVSHPRGCGDVNTGIVVAEDTLREIVVALDSGAVRRDGLFSRAVLPLDDRVHVFHCLLLRSLSASGPPDPLPVEEVSLRLVAHLVRRSAQSAPEPRRLPLSQRETAEAARALLHEPLEARTSLAALAQAVGVSPFHLCRVFRAHTGTTLHGYRTLLRLRQALTMLIETELGLVEIAEATGFADRSHLSRRCRETLGWPPSALRRRRPRAEARRMLEGLLPA